MIDLLRYLAVVRQSDQAITRAAGQAFRRLLDLIRQGNAPRAAIDQVMREFNADTLSGFREAFSAVLESSLGVKELKAWPVGGVKLSQRLYQNAQQVSATAKTIIEQHLKGLHNAQELRKALYEGYNFQQDPLKIIKPLPKYLQVEFDQFKAAQLKTPALRAAYLEAIRKAEAGAGMEVIEKQLRIAFYERNRYFANRIARTELHRAYTDQQARELMEQERIQYVQWRLSSKHPHSCICDYHAKVDLYGLGPGIYPKAEAPKPPAHPFCACVLSPVISLIHPKAKFNPKAERTFLATLPAKEAAQIAGSFEKRRRILEDKESLEGIYNAGKDPLYQWKKIGDIETMPVFIRSSTVQQAEQEALRLGVKSVDYRQSLDIANDVNAIFEQIIQKGGALPHYVEVDDAVFISWGKQYQFNPDRVPAAFWADDQTGDTYFYLNPTSSYWLNKQAQAQHEHSTGYWATDHQDHPIWHELGHVMQYDNSSMAYQTQTKLTPAELAIAGKVSGYAQMDVREFVAETFAALSLGKTLPNDVLTLYQLYGGLLP